jgi:hypothetical protein
MSDILVVGICSLALSFCAGGALIKKHGENREQQFRELELATYLDDIQSIA